MKGKCIVAQSGGPTAVINASACGVIQEAFRHPEITGVYAAHNGIHCASLTDSREAYAAGREAVRHALKGVSAKMVTITPGGFFVTRDFFDYALPLIQGEVKPAMKDGLPEFIRFEKHFITR